TVLLGQVRTTDADVHDRYAERLRLIVELLAHRRHELLALVPDPLRERSFTQHTPKGGVQQGRQPRIGSFNRSNRLIKEKRMPDAVAGKRIDYEPLLVGSDHFLRRILEIENAFVDINAAVDHRNLVVQSRLVHDPYRLAQSHYQSLPRLVDGKERPVGDYGGENNNCRDQPAKNIEPHREPPGCGAPGALRPSWSSGR